MLTFGSEPAVAAWQEFMRAGAEALAALYSVSQYAALTVESEDEMAALSEMLRVLADSTGAFVEVELRILSVLRDDLAPD
jgi:hypothetical protein